MRTIKFNYIFQHEETGRLLEKTYSYLEVFNGMAKKEKLALDRYSLIAKREFTRSLTIRNRKEIL